MSDEFDDIRKQILEDLNVIIQRVNDSPSGRDSERVSINVKTELVGQDALNYLVAKVFMRDLTDAELIDIIFKIGLNYSLQIVKAAAETEYNIKI